jgi:hypothetical protein
MTDKASSLQNNYHLAQINIAKMKAPLNDPIMAEFANALDEVNLVAEKSPGFVWRLQTASGNATDLQAYSDPKILVNISLWQSIEQLKTYVYQSLHGDFFVRRRKWFEKYRDEHFAMWWVQAGHLPTVEEGKAKLEYLELHGDTPECFTFAEPYAPSELGKYLIEQYISAYNTFDLDGMMSLLHPEIEFENISQGEVNAKASGASEFRAMAEQSKALFKSRKQTISRCDISQNEASVAIIYEGILAQDLPNGIKSGSTINLNGRSQFSFKDGKIWRIVDIS